MKLVLDEWIVREVIETLYNARAAFLGITGLDSPQEVAKKSANETAITRRISKAIDIIQQSKQPTLPEGLEEAAKNRVTENGRFPISEFEELRIRDIKFGAEWQKVQDQKTIELAEDHAMLAGMNKMEQQMMDGAVEHYVVGEIAGSPVGPAIVHYDESLNIGDKVKVIVIKEDDK